MRASVVYKLDLSKNGANGSLTIYAGSAFLIRPNGIVFDAYGNLYICDSVSAPPPVYLGSCMLAMMTHR